MTFTRPLANEAEYDAALAAIEPYFRNEPAPGIPEAEAFDTLFALIEAYEAIHHPISDEEDQAAAPAKPAA